MLRRRGRDRCLGRRHRRPATALTSGVAVLLLAAACSSSSQPSSSPTASATGSASGSSKTYTIGVLGDFTGVASASADSTYAGIKAGIGLAAQDGYKIKFVTADTNSSPRVH